MQQKVWLPLTRFLLISSRFHAQQGQKVIRSLAGVTILIRGQVAFQFVIFNIQLVPTCTKIRILKAPVRNIFR